MLPIRAVRPVLARGTRGFSNESAWVPREASIWQNLFGATAMPSVSLDKEFGPTKVEESQKNVTHEAKISTLPSGLRIASLESVSPIAHVGVFVDTGSRYESGRLSGISHFLESLAFKSTKHRSAFRLLRDMSRIGANIHCSANREHVMFAADALATHVPELLETLADVLQNPALDHHEIEELKGDYQKFLENLTPELQLTEALHAAAFKKNTLGLPLYANKNSLKEFNEKNLEDWIQNRFTPKKMVVSAVGVEHETLAQYVNVVFNNLRTDVSIPTEKAQYTGGETLVHDRDAQWANIAIGFEAGNWHSKELIPVCVLQALMGGGGSFSAGGPGKGMYSRLYKNVLAHGWVEAAQSVTHLYNDGGIFAISGKVHPTHAPDFVKVLTEEIHAMGSNISDVELTRAKNSLKSTVFLNLESRALQVEDLGRQVVTYGKVTSAHELGKLIDAVTVKDIEQLVKKMVKTAPSVAAVGELSSLPRYDEIARGFK